MQEAVYDSIATEYKDSKQLPFRHHIETYTLSQLTGNIAGLKVLDLACGEGFYTRKLKQANAHSVMGVDISPKMIQLAERHERRDPIGCSYMVADAAEMPYLGAHDLIIAMYLLNYAKTPFELFSFCKAAYDQLKPGGRFIGFNDNIKNDPRNYGTYRKYGFVKDGKLDRIEGDPITYTFFNLDGSTFQFDNYYLRSSTFEAAFRAAGFKTFRWTGVQLSPSQNNAASFWDQFLADPPVTSFYAEK